MAFDILERLGMLAETPHLKEFSNGEIAKDLTRPL